MAEECLYAGSHVRAPSNPIKYRRWAERMRKTHVQTLCPGCNQWVVWKQKESADGPTTATENQL